MSQPEQSAPNAPVGKGGVPVPASRPAPARRRRNWFGSLRAEDREFLPAAIEILGTPPSPIATSFIWLICAIFAVAIAWSYFGEVDIYAVARGKIQVVGRSKVVQPFEPGKVAAILARSGAVVQEGDVLVQLDPTEALADQKRLTDDLMAADAELARRLTAIEAARFQPGKEPRIEFKSGTSEFVRQREENVLKADLAHLAAGLQTLEGQSTQQRAAEQRLRDSIAQREKLIALSKERVKMREELQTSGSGSRAMVIEALTQYENEQTTQTSEKGQLNETVANIAVTQRKIEETVAQFVADQNQKRADVERKRDQVSQDLIKARSKHERMSIKAPVTGLVEQLAVTTVGQVVSAGQILMTIVPRDSPLEIQALVLNKDIGFVRPGQSAVVKVDAFPFTRYGTIDGRVTEISSDAVDMRTAQNLSDDSEAVKPQGAAANSSTSTPTLVFPATVTLSAHGVDVNGREVPFTPGMTATVEIKTGRRRIIDYILSPLREVTSNAAHER